jgi:imidazolonepropionase-like amidohydrolase
MPSAAPLVVIAGRLVDVAADAVLTDRAVVLEGERIRQVVPAADAPNAPTIDLSSRTVLPGMIDCHAHLIGEMDDGQGYAYLVNRSSAQEALTGVTNARATVLSGFTTVRDVGTFHAFVDLALREAIDSGRIIGPRMMCAGAYITCPGGGGDITGLPPDVPVPSELRVGVSVGPDQVRANVRRIFDAGADFIKVIATGAVFTSGTTPSKPEFTEEEIHAAVDEAAKAGTFVAAHAHGAEGIKNAVRAGVRTIEHGSYLDDEGIKLMLEHGTWLVADIYNGDYTEEVGTRDNWPEEILRKNRETTDIQRQAFAKAVKAGVRIAFGTDAGIYPHGDNAKQFAYMVKYGMTPLDAIRAATTSAAASLGRSQELGSLSPGKYGDMIAVAGDPLQDINQLLHISGVIKQGKLISQGNAK